MSATDMSDTLRIALQTSGLNQIKVLHRPRRLSDNGPCLTSKPDEPDALLNRRTIVLTTYTKERLDDLPSTPR